MKLRGADDHKIFEKVVGPERRVIHDELGGCIGFGCLGEIEALDEWGDLETSGGFYGAVGPDENGRLYYLQVFDKVWSVHKLCDLCQLLGLGELGDLHDPGRLDWMKGVEELCCFEDFPGKWSWNQSIDMESIIQSTCVIKWRIKLWIYFLLICAIKNLLYCHIRWFQHLSYPNYLCWIYTYEG